MDIYLDNNATTRPLPEVAGAVAECLAAGFANPSSRIWRVAPPARRSRRLGQPSHVLLAMGFDEARANASLRFSLSRFTTEAEIEAAIGIVREVVATSLDVQGV